MSAIYSPERLQSFSSLQELFSGKEELKKIQDASGTLYMERWHVSLILITSPIRVILYAALKILGLFSMRLELEAEHLIHPLNAAFNHLQYGERLLMPILNDYRKDTPDVYKQKTVQRSEIKEPLIRQKLHPKLEGVKFFWREGLCSGSIYWFNFLFLKGKQGELSCKEYCQKIASEFDSGQPRQAALMQSLYGLQLELTGISETLSKYPVEDGVYHLGLPKHSVSYIQFGNERLIMDPAVGLIEIRCDAHLKEVIEEYTKGHPNEPIFFAKQELSVSWLSHLAAWLRIR